MRLGVRIRSICMCGQPVIVARDAVELFDIETGKLLEGVYELQIGFDTDGVVRATIGVLLQKVEIKE